MEKAIGKVSKQVQFLPAPMVERLNGGKGRADRESCRLYG